MNASQLLRRLLCEFLHLNYQEKEEASLGRLISNVQVDGLVQVPPCARLSVSKCGYASLQYKEGHLGCELSEPQLRGAHLISSRSVERRILS